jgi:hypothetical protein
VPLTTFVAIPDSSEDIVQSNISWMDNLWALIAAVDLTIATTEEAFILAFFVTTVIALNLA